MSALESSILSARNEGGESPRCSRSQPEWRRSTAPMTPSTCGMTAELCVTLIYLVATSIGDLQASTLGLMVGPVPVFLTDITLFLLFAVSFVRWPSRILFWLSEGFGAGSVGRAVWLIVILAVVRFCFAVSEYSLFAARDLAIFAYSLFYPLVYFAIRERRDAVRLLRYFTYAGVIAAALLVLQETIGLNLGLFEVSKRIALGHTVRAVRSGNENAFSIFSLLSLTVYVMCERKLRAFHTACAIVCFFSLVDSDGRANVVAVILGAGTSLYCATARQRVGFLLAVALVALPVVLTPMIPNNIPVWRQLEGFRLSVISAAGGPSVDGNAQFRALRWHAVIDLWSENPFLGVGFGRDIVPRGLVDSTERKGRFNVGMPHNSFLFLGARTGLVGLSLFLFCWAAVLWRLTSEFRRTYRVEELAVANILAAMFGFAMFGLFIERPGTDASFWILLAIGTRLVES